MKICLKQHKLDLNEHLYKCDFHTGGGAAEQNGISQ